MKFAGSDWLIESNIEVSDFGIVVADIVGQVWRGIYHMPRIRTRNWSNKKEIRIPVSHDLSTFDSSKLTELVVLCHDRCVRLEIIPCNMQYVTCVFTPRQREGSRYTSHPTMIDAVRSIRFSIGEEQPFELI